MGDRVVRRWPLFSLETQQLASVLDMVHESTGPTVAFGHLSLRGKCASQPPPATNRSSGAIQYGAGKFKYGGFLGSCLISNMSISVKDRFISRQMRESADAGVPDHDVFGHCASM